jgi:hypothetical protein
MDPIPTAMDAQSLLTKKENIASVHTQALQTPDGKTDDCDRAHTFDTFVDGKQMPREDCPERMGRGKRIWRALKRALRRRCKRCDGTKKRDWCASA